MEKIVIIGGVAAGATAAAKARRISPDAEIVILEAGPDISFANCGLPYYIGGDIKSRSKLILQSPESFKNQYNVDVYTQTLVTKIDSTNHIVKTQHQANGEKKEFSYTKLILAQGGRPIKPNLPGANLSHVFTLWTLEDMDNIVNFIDKNAPKTAVVVGGGFIGLEMVEALAKRKLKVEVVEKMPHVMSILEPEVAGFIENEMLSYGVGIHTSVGVVEIKPNSVKLDDGTEIVADMVLLSIGVRPTLQLAIDAGLKIGEAGGLWVNEYLQTSDKDIYAAGDMVEIEHRVNGAKVRIPLAGPANRQGRIAAENALGGHHEYKGSIGTSIVRVFESVAGSTGLSLKQARELGMDADAVTIHKEHHTGYYPGAELVTVMAIYDKKTGVILGGQTCGYKGADRRLDILAMAVANKLTVKELADVDFAYSPPLGTPNDPVNMVAFAAENRMSGYSPSITVSELDSLAAEKNPIYIDVRNDIFAFEKAHLKGVMHIPYDIFSSSINQIPRDKTILLYCTTGLLSHKALRILKNEGFNEVYNISGGLISMQRYETAIGFQHLIVPPLEVEEKPIHKENKSAKMEEAEAEVEKQMQVDFSSPIIIDVRTPEEYLSGAYPNAINLSLDELALKLEMVIGTNLQRDITLYCASGARSSYAQQYLTQLGYTNVKDGGGLMHMMMRNR